jgi:drug/metabolite transporter (DMT)-like permease
VFRVAVEAFVALLLFGAIPVTVRAVHANPFTIGIVRLSVATAVFAAFIAMRGELRRLSVRDTARVAFIGAIFAAHWLLLFFAVKVSSASIGAIGLSTYGIHLLILGTLVLRERPRVTDVVAVLLAAAGAVLVVPLSTVGDGTAFGMLLATLSAFLYATLPLLHQRWRHIPTPMRTLGQFGFALALFLLFLPRANWTLSGADWGGLLFLAIGVTLIGHSLWVRVTTHLPSSVTSIIYYGNIPVAIALGVMLLDEPLAARTLAGAVLIAAGSMVGLVARAVSVSSSSPALP